MSKKDLLSPSSASSDEYKPILVVENDDSLRERFVRWMPVAFTIAVIEFLASVYWIHIWKTWDGSKLVEACFFVFFYFLLTIAFAQAALTAPGDVPDSPEWSSLGNVKTLEAKRTGDRRYCKWCDKYKPDRAHHCRVCKRCVLKMDHHCPWLHNCVGFHNHKYFLVLIFYGTVCASFVGISILPSAIASTEEKHLKTMVLFISGEVIAGTLVFLLSLFLCYHLWILMKGMTTIEFCEKSSQYNFRSQYNLGCLQNLYSNLGPHWYLWCLPFSPAIGDGCSYEVDTEQLGFAPKSMKDLIRGRAEKRNILEV